MLHKILRFLFGKNVLPAKVHKTDLIFISTVQMYLMFKSIVANVTGSVCGADIICHR